jgi:hypothetical protein
MANFVNLGYKSVGRTPDTYFTGTKPSDLFNVQRIIHVRPYADAIDVDIKVEMTYDEGAARGATKYYVAQTLAQVLTAVG